MDKPQPKKTGQIVILMYDDGSVYIESDIKEKATLRRVLHESEEQVIFNALMKASEKPIIKSLTELVH